VRESFCYAEIIERYPRKSGGYFRQAVENPVPVEKNCGKKGGCKNGV
jgi:hypothetical protein